MQGQVVLYTGETVSSNSESWRAECEARYILRLPAASRCNLLHAIEQKRGADGAARVKALVRDIEPYYVLSLPDREQRRSYLAKVELERGSKTSQRLRERVLSIHHERLAS